ncbi:MAG: DUF1015 domain-containing protein [Desulfobacteraceae bacterium]
MAEVVPFRGVLYNPEAISNIADVVAPPYDVISPKEQDGFYQKHAKNVIRLILGKSETTDQSQSDIHARAAGYFKTWLSEGTLIRDTAPGFYLTSVTFPVGDRQATRYGIIGNVRLEPFERGIVLPHERTFSKVKSERLKLMQICHANFSPIFGLYSDGNGILDQLMRYADGKAPDMELLDDKGLRHKLWRITDPRIQAHVTDSMKDQCIYIADGHHRYETALNYRQWVRERTSDFDENHPANFVMMSLSSLKDPGMVIFPAHRLLKAVSADERNALLDKVERYFTVRSYSTEQGMEQALAEFDKALAVNARRNAIGLYMADRAALYTMILKDGVMQERYGNELPEALTDLDVTVLTRLLMMELLQFDQARLDDATKIGYATTSRAAVGCVQDGDADMAFILNPTRIEQVQRVAQEGLIMPRKSTYFYPKVLSGQVFNLLI